MDELLEHLDKSKLGVFEPSELNEVILMVYNIIRRSVRDKCDFLTLTPTHFVLHKEGCSVNRFPVDRPKPTMSFREALKRILDRDEVVRRYLHLVAETPEEISYQIVLEETS